MDTHNAPRWKHRPRRNTFSKKTRVAIAVGIHEAHKKPVPVTLRTPPWEREEAPKNDAT